MNTLSTEETMNSTETETELTVNEEVSEEEVEGVVVKKTKNSYKAKYKASQTELFQMNVAKLEAEQQLEEALATIAQMNLKEESLTFSLAKMTEHRDTFKNSFESLKLNYCQMEEKYIDELAEAKKVKTKTTDKKKTLQHTSYNEELETYHYTITPESVKFLTEHAIATDNEHHTEAKKAVFNHTVKTPTRTEVAEQLTTFFTDRLDEDCFDEQSYICDTGTLEYTPLTTSSGKKVRGPDYYEKVNGQLLVANGKRKAEIPLIKRCKAKTYCGKQCNKSFQLGTCYCKQHNNQIAETGVLKLGNF